MLFREILHSSRVKAFKRDDSFRFIKSLISFRETTETLQKSRFSQDKKQKRDIFGQFFH